MKKAVIFDLDGVIVSTDECHYQAWKRIANEEGILFDREINQRLRGVSRMESLDIILEKSDISYTDKQKIELAERKNSYYRSLLGNMSLADILPGVLIFLDDLKKHGIKTAIGSSSKNTPYILEKIGLSHFFNAIADGNEIKKSKPDPEVFLLAAKKLDVSPAECVVIEDAHAGIEAAKAGGMKAIGIGFAKSCENADMTASFIADLSVDEVLR